MISIYQYNSYKNFFNAWAQSQANKGHGEYRKLALALNVSTTMISQVFNGEKDLSLELICELADYLHLNEAETEYLLLLAEYSKAGSEKLKSKFNKQIIQKQNEAQKLAHRLAQDYSLGEQAKQIYFSSWVYPAIRILCDVPEYNTADQIAERLKLSRNHVGKCLDFLIQQHIVIEKEGHLQLGPAHIYLSSSDPLVGHTHLDWRNLGHHKRQVYNEDHFFYSGQYALSKEVLYEIRRLLPDFVESVLKKVKPSASETACSLNIDFFEF